MNYALIGAAGTIVGMIVGYLTFVRNKSKDDKGEGQQTGIVLTEIGYIKSSIEGLNKKLDRMEDKNMEYAERLSAVEASAKQAHKRIDRMEGLHEGTHEI